MKAMTAISFRRSLAAVAAATLLGACADESPLEPDGHAVSSAQFARASSAEDRAVIATLRRATARYHNLKAAIADGFVLLHPCEVRPGEGPTGRLYANLDRVMDGVIDPEKPEGLLYQPSRNGRPKLVAVDLAIPYALWTEPEPPEFLGATFQREDEFAAWALHVWIWRHNPDGMFAIANPKVSC